jgi:hypothetical protein
MMEQVLSEGSLYDYNKRTAGIPLQTVMVVNPTLAIMSI